MTDRFVIRKEIREAYAYQEGGGNPDDRREARTRFYAWLAEELAAAWDEGAEAAEYNLNPDNKPILINPYWIGDQDD